MINLTMSSWSFDFALCSAVKLGEGLPQKTATRAWLLVQPDVCLLVIVILRERFNSQLQGEPSSLPKQAARRSPTATGCSRGSSAGAFRVCFPGVGAKWGGLERYVWQLFFRRQSSTCCSSHPGAQGRGRGAGTEPPGAGEVRVPGWEGARRRSLVVEEGAGDAEAGARQEAAEAGSRRSPAG